MTIKPSKGTGSSPNVHLNRVNSQSNSNNNLNSVVNNTLDIVTMTTSGPNDDSVEMLFTPGSVIKLTTGLGQVFEGEVVSFDYERKVIIIKIPSSSKPGHCDIHLVNLDAVTDVVMIKEVKYNSNNHNNLINNLNQSFPSINLKKVNDKLAKQSSDRKSLATAFADGVTEDGLRLFMSLQKTIGKDNLSWKSKDIIVNHVLIKPPYKGTSDCIKPETDKVTKIAEDYVKQLVCNYWDNKTRTSPVKDGASKDAKDGKATDAKEVKDANMNSSVSSPKDDAKQKTNNTAKEEVVGKRDMASVVKGSSSAAATERNKNGNNNNQVASVSISSPTPSTGSSSGNDHHQKRGAGQQVKTSSTSSAPNKANPKKGSKNGPN